MCVVYRHIRGLANVTIVLVLPQGIYVARVIKCEEGITNTHRCVHSACFNRNGHTVDIRRRTVSLHPYDSPYTLFNQLYVQQRNCLVPLLRMASSEIQKALKKRQTAVVRKRDNRTCCDCTEDGESTTRAAILRVGPNDLAAPPGAHEVVVFLCRSCAKAHAKLGPEISHVIRLEFDECKDIRLRVKLTHFQFSNHQTTLTHLKTFQGTNIMWI